MNNPSTNPSILKKIEIIIEHIYTYCKIIETNPSIDKSEYPIVANYIVLQDMKKILIDTKGVKLEDGYKRYKPPIETINGKQIINDGHNGLRCLIYGILFIENKFINDYIISIIIKLLYVDPITSPILLNKPSKSNNFKYATNLTTPNENKRHILDILNTIMCLIDESFNYGASAWWGGQDGKKGNSWFFNHDVVPDYKEDLLGYLIYIIAFYNVRWLTKENIETYRLQFRNSLIQCNNPSNKCKNNSLGRQRTSIDKILAIQTIDPTPYIA
jgi:hypothetical protein